MKDVCYIHTCDLVPHNISPKGVAKEIVYERIPIYKETILDIINASILPSGKKPSKILIGPDELFELTGDYRFTKINKPFEKACFFEDSYRIHGFIYDIELVIIPHMKGILII